jgi:F/Y-rich N-terminus
MQLDRVHLQGEGSTEGMMKSGDEVFCADSSSKPIKKRVVSDDAARDDDDFEDYHDGRSSSSAGNLSSNGDGGGSESNSSETKAWKDLHDFLEAKGIDVSRELTGYRVHVQLSKNRRLPAGSFTVTYSGPDGDILTSKSDVLNAIKRNVSLNSNKLHIPRADIYATSQRKFNNLIEEEGLPVMIDGIRIISFGTIDSDNSSFHSPIEIYPVGYTAELSIPALPAVRGRTPSKTSKVSSSPYVEIPIFLLLLRIFSEIFSATIS